MKLRGTLLFLSTVTAALATALYACVSDDNAALPTSDASTVTPGSDSGGGFGGDDAGPPFDAAFDALAPVDGGSPTNGSDSGNAGDAGFACADAGTGRCLYVLATGQGNPEGLTLSGGYLYWIEEGALGRIERMLLPAGPTEVLATGFPQSSTLTVDATRVYWTQANHGIIYAAPNTGILDGGAATVLATVDGGGTADLLVDSTRAYWTDFNAGRVYAAPLTGVPDGGAPTVLASGQLGPSQLASDGVNLYWSDNTSGDVMAESLVDGGGPVVLATGVYTATEIQVLGSTVYVANSAQAILYSLPTSGVPDGGAPSVFQNAGTYPDASTPQNLSDFVFDGTNVYWATTGNPNGEVLMATPGGAPIPLALGMTSPGSLAYDATYLYWANFAYGGVFKMEK